MTPRTATCPRDGSLTLAFFGSGSTVDPSIEKTVASRSAEPAVGWGIVPRSYEPHWTERDVGDPDRLDRIARVSATRTVETT